MGLLPDFSAAGQVAKAMRSTCSARGRCRTFPTSPRFVFCATNLQSGVLFRFSKPYAGDYVIGRLDRPKIRLSQAVAASSAFPPVLSPHGLTFPRRQLHRLADVVGAVLRAKNAASAGRSC